MFLVGKRAPRKDIKSGRIKREREHVVLRVILSTTDFPREGGSEGHGSSVEIFLHREIPRGEGRQEIRSPGERPDKNIFHGTLPRALTRINDSPVAAGRTLDLWCRLAGQGPRPWCPAVWWSRPGCPPRRPPRMAHPGSAADYRSRPARSHKRPRRRCSAAVPRAPRPPESRGSVSCRSPGKEERKRREKRACKIELCLRGNYVNFKEGLDLTCKRAGA